MLRFPTLEEVISFHSYLEDGQGVKDWGTLNSIVAGHSPTWGGVDLKPKVSDKAAHYWFKFTKFHCFINGNKRIGVVVFLDFLNMNGYTHNFSHKGLIDLSLTIAEGKYDEEEIAYLVKNNIYKKG